jgi:hypothetical protein
VVICAGSGSELVRVGSAAQEHCMHPSAAESSTSRARLLTTANGLLGRLTLQDRDVGPTYSVVRTPHQIDTTYAFAGMIAFFAADPGASMSTNRTP